MEEQDLPALQQENTMLRKIVSILLEQNEAIKAENRHLRQQTEAKQSIHSTSKEGITPKHELHSPSGKAMTPNELLDSLSKEGVTLNEEIDSVSEKGTASNELIHSTSQEDVAPNQLPQSNGQEGRGMNVKLEPLPLKLALSNENIYPLASELLSAGFGGGKKDAALTAAKLLLHFYNEMPGEYSRLLNLTAYSQGGLAKLMMNLRRKGYLIKCGFQQHAVTGEAYKLMQQAGCK